MAAFPNYEIFESLNPQEVSRAANLFETLKQLRIKLKNGDEAVLERAFEYHVQGVLDKLDARLHSIHDPQQQSVELIMARHGLYDAAFQQVALLCHSISPALGDSVKELRQVHSSFMTDFHQAVGHFVQENARLQAELNKWTATTHSLRNDVMQLEDVVNKLNQESEEQNTKIIDLRRHLRGATQEVQQLRENGEVKKSQPAFDTSVSIFADMASPNKATNLRRSNSSNTLSTNSNPATPRFMQSKKSAAGRSFQYNDFNMSGASVGDESAPRMPKSPSATSLNTPHRGPLSLKAPVNWLHQFREDVQRAIDDGRCRGITLKECKEMMDKIYESKSIANEKAQQGIGNLPMETLEQHTFRTMEKKYGLRSLAVEHAGMLLQALEQYAHEDNEVSVFQKIFRNEIEEDFRLVQTELNKAIRDLTMIQIMGRNPTKDQPTLQGLLEQKLATGSIYEDEWTDMINYMYHESDRAALGLLLKRQALHYQDDSPAISASAPASQVLNTSYLGPHKITKGNSAFVVGVPSQIHHTHELHNTGVIGYDKGSARDVKRLGYSSTTLKISVKDPSIKSKKEMLKMPYPEFIKIVLDFQLRSHQEYLAQCLKLFRQADNDVDGVLNAAEFREFFQQLKRHTHEAEQGFSPGVSLDRRQQEEEEELHTVFALLKTLDPFETDRIVFSSAVTCLQKLQHVHQ